MSEILPCPFCGSSPKCSTAYDENEDGLTVSICFECPDGCAVSRDKPTYDGALEAWNTRAPSSPNAGAVRQPFSKHPALAVEIERMAGTGQVGSLIDWDRFLNALNAALPQEGGER